MLERTRGWLAREPAARAALEAVDPDPLAAAVSLRWAAALHHLALRGQAPWAALWPPAAAGDAQIDAAIGAAWAGERVHLDRALARAPQTNEVQRSAALLPGLLHVAAATGLPLALFEIGSSAGLNLWPERHRVDYGSWARGPADAPLALRCDWQGPVPAGASAALTVRSRAGCDLHPVDLRVADEALRLRSFVWPDQAERVARLARAIEVTVPWQRAEGVAVQAQSAAVFAAAQLAAPREGVATVLMHTIMWQYLPAAEQQAIAATLDAAGRRATRTAPLAWLRLEPPVPEARAELRCRLWPGGADVLLGRAHPHVASFEATAP